MQYLVDHGISVSKSSELSGMSRQSFYYRPRERIKALDPDISIKIREIVEQRPSYGTRRVRALIRRSGITISRKKVQRHMRAMNLIKTHNKRHRNNLPRRIIVARLNRLWETDFTKIYIDGDGWVHFLAQMDVCSRKIKGYLVSRMARTHETIQCLDNGILDEFPDLVITGLTIRSDNGSQYTSHKYEEHLRTLHIPHETTHPSTPEQNGHMESCFGRFKEDYIYSRDFRSYDEFRLYMDWAVHDYNTQRPHSALGYLTPEEFESRMCDPGFRESWIEKEKGRLKDYVVLE